MFRFGTSGLLYRSNKLMYDRETETLWRQFTGEPVVGPLATSNIRLKILPIVLTTWQEWLEQHPDTKVLDIDTGFDRDYIPESEPGAVYQDYFASPDPLFPVGPRDERLSPKDVVFALQVRGVPKAYPSSLLARERVVNDSLAGVDLVVLSDGPQGAARAYRRDGHTFTAPLTEGPVQAVRDEDGGLWGVTEEALVLEGDPSMTLERLPGHMSFWFGWYQFFPQTLLYGDGSE